MSFFRPSVQLQAGFNLLELLAVLFIVGVFSLMLAPSINDALSSMNAKAEIYRFKSFVSHARKHALLQTSYVHICSLDSNGEKCSSVWKNEIISFIDVNKNHQFDLQLDKLVSKIKLEAPYSYLRSNSLNYIRFNKLGMNTKIGSIIFCYKKNSFEQVKKISASMQGRFKVYEYDEGGC